MSKIFECYECKETSTPQPCRLVVDDGTEASPTTCPFLGGRRMSDEMWKEITEQEEQ